MFVGFGVCISQTTFLDSDGSFAACTGLQDLIEQHWSNKEEEKPEIMIKDVADMIENKLVVNRFKQDTSLQQTNALNHTATESSYSANALQNISALFGPSQTRSARIHSPQDVFA